jgi:hypothetical protein
MWVYLPHNTRKTDGNYSTRPAPGNKFPSAGAILLENAHLYRYNLYLYLLLNRYRFSGTNEVVHLYWVRYPVQFTFVQGGVPPRYKYGWLPIRLHLPLPFVYVSVTVTVLFLFLSYLCGFLFLISYIISSYLISISISILISSAQYKSQIYITQDDHNSNHHKVHKFTRFRTLKFDSQVQNHKREDSQV